MSFLKTRPLTISILFLGLLELVFYYPGILFWGSFVILVLVVSGVLMMMHGNWERGILRRSLLPILLTMGVLSFIFFMPEPVFRQVIMIVSTICLYFVLLNIDQFPYKSFLITRLNFSFVSLVAAYLLYYSVSHLSVSFAMPLWTLMLIVVAVSFGIVYSVLWASGIDRSKTILYTVLFGFLMSEVFLVVSFWPVDPSAKSIVLVVALYIFWGIFSHWLERIITKRVVLEYILVGLILVGVVLVTASWLPPFLI